MSVTVRVPAQLRTLTGGAAQVSAEGSTVGEVLKALDAAHPGFADRLFDECGSLRRFVNVFLADEDVRFLDGLDTPVDRGPDPVDRPRRRRRLSPGRAEVGPRAPVRSPRSPLPSELGHRPGSQAGTGCGPPPGRGLLLALEALEC